MFKKFTRKEILPINMKNTIDIPQHEIDNLARSLLPEIQKFFNSEKGKQEFEEWKRNQDNNK